MIAIVDYKMGNIGSISNALSYLGLAHIVTNKNEEILNATKIILPGVGAFKDAIKLLTNSGLDLIIKEAALKKIPILGICLGYQLLFEKSYEFGNHLGLGLVSGEIKYLSVLNEKIPHVGWNTINIKNDCPLFKGIEDDSYFYFVHSYGAYNINDRQTAAITNYENDFVCAVWNKNIYGVQFHPEKSGEAGLKILKNFGEL